jgi:hypothetical protein
MYFHLLESPTPLRGTQFEKHWSIPFYTPSYRDMKMVQFIATARCSSFQIIFKTHAKAAENLKFITIIVNKIIYIYQIWTNSESQFQKHMLLKRTSIKVRVWSSYHFSCMQLCPLPNFKKTELNTTMTTVWRVIELENSLLKSFFTWSAECCTGKH